jgi:cytoskeletal protein CcmA (bactofilin family)
MKKSLFLISFVSIILYSFQLEARVLIGEKISIKEPALEEIFSIGDDIYISASLKNEFIGIGRKILARTDVDGDFIGIGFNLNFSGIANNDIYLIGNIINVAGNVGGSVTALCKNIHIKTLVDGNLRVGAERIYVDGKVKGRTLLWGKNIVLKGEFNDIALYGNEIHFAPDTVIYGNMDYTAPEKMDISHLDVRGKIQWNKPFMERAKETTPITLLKRFYTFFSLLIPILLMLGLFPNLFKQTATISGKKFLQCFGTGLLFIIIMVIVLPVMFITIIGAPLGLIVASLFLSSLYISRVFPVIFIGRIVLFKMQERNLTWVFATLIGIFLFTIISLHPTAKILLNLILVPSGLGALLMSRVNLMQRLRKEKIL